MGPVGHYVGCFTPNVAAHSEFEAWFAKTASKLGVRHVEPSSCPGGFCRLSGGLYLEDRCWNPRAVCGVRTSSAWGGNATLVVGQRAEVPVGLALQPNR